MINIALFFLQNLIWDYIKKNGLKIKQFKDGKPGHAWLRSFLKRNELTIKKAKLPPKVAEVLQPLDVLEVNWDELAEG